MLVFTAAGKGGAGQTVTGCNMAYQLALKGEDVAYLDFDFGRPSAGATFDIDAAARGVTRDGVRSFLLGGGPRPVVLDVATRTAGAALRNRPPGAGRLVLLPGDRGARWFGRTAEIVQRCSELFLRTESEYSVTVVDLGSGRTVAVDLVLEVMARPEMRNIVARWLVVHQWTRLHVDAAGDFVHGPSGLLDTARHTGLDPAAVERALRFVRCIVADKASLGRFGQVAQQAWQAEMDAELRNFAAEQQLGIGAVLGTVPFDPVLKLREQIITGFDVASVQIARQDTVEAYASLARRLSDHQAWETL
ncbi:conserved hypothetical protein [Catenulispora acidiphila DSM 44928]|uniref:CobQ/CobB/MinD/ParA nucleotide binding domain-containing protein n=1 Tax=Catenulispora acidiphila (strain DSM 44928 / JCM 14897 / NBRC 102108 / NRRL B-24433 / ID139908) TaxID=479433 RepID=C7QDH5_CATAD|nr:SCO2523 family variant P-loop protein [Catenulispora acidiphila]ACU72768.1 conserved hypothetical protein [Catenulispora acidiphila DSM 44928]